MSLGRNMAKVTFYGKFHLFNRDAEVILSSCLKSNMSQISMVNKTLKFSKIHSHRCTGSSTELWFTGTRWEVDWWRENIYFLQNQSREVTAVVADLTQKMEDETFIFWVRRWKFPQDISAASVSSQVCACMFVSVCQHKIKHFFYTHCCFECCKCTLLLCDVYVNCGNLNSFSFTTKLKRLRSFAQFCSIFRNYWIAAFVVVCVHVSVCEFLCACVFLNNDKLWLHRGVW